MFALLLTVLLAQATATPPPERLPLSGWTAAPSADPLEYAHYVRLENDGSQSMLFVTRQVCDCEPLHLAAPANTLRNSEAIAFRDGNALVMMTYTFRSPAPLADAEATLATLCPLRPV